MGGSSLTALATQIVESSAPYDGWRMRVADVIAGASGQTVLITDSQTGATSTAVTMTDGSAPTSTVRIGQRDVIGSWAGPSTSSGTMTFATSGVSAATLYLWGPANLSLTAGTISSVTPRTVERSNAIGGDPGTTGWRGVDYAGFQHIVLRFPSVADQDTFTCAGVKDFCWETAETTATASVAYSSGAFTFTVVSGPITNFKLHIWKRG